VKFCCSNLPFWLQTTPCLKSVCCSNHICGLNHIKSPYPPVIKQGNGKYTMYFDIFLNTSVFGGHSQTCLTNGCAFLHVERVA
jgi:hypothetical protein